MANPTKINWHEVRAAYVEGHVPNPAAEPFRRIYPTLDEVATLFGISIGLVTRHSGKERWLDQRAAFAAEVEQARRAHVMESRVAQVGRIDERGLSNAEAGLGLVSMRLTYLLRREQQTADADRGTRVDARELSTLGLAAKRFLDVKAQILGQPLTAVESADADERAQRVEERRLADDLMAFIAERRAEDAAEHADAP